MIRSGRRGVFLLNSPVIQDIQVKRRGDVRRAKLYYLRDLEGKAARIKEKIAVRARPADAGTAAK